MGHTAITDNLQPGQSKVEKLLVGVARASNVLLTAERFDKEILEAFNILGQAADVDRVYLFENSFDPEAGARLMSQRYEWCRPGVDSYLDDPALQELAYQDIFPEWERPLASGHPVGGIVRHLPETMQRIFEPQAIQTVLLVPVLFDDEFWGFLGFDDCRRERTWSEAERAILSTASGSFAGAIMKHRYEEKLVAAKEAAEELAELKSAFLNNMSHEIRTPLAGILGCASLLIEELPSEHHELVQLITNNGERLLATLDAVLKLARLQASGVLLKKTEVNVGGLVRDVVVHHQVQADQKGIAIRVEAPAEPVITSTDASVLSSLLGHILSNAVKFTEEGGIDIELGRQSGAVAITIKDTGIGIGEEFLPHIFDAFRQESTGIARSHEGSGVGLTITKHLVELIGGTISVSSKPQSGTSFIVKIPG